jgi:PAS domain-containing protein
MSRMIPKKLTAGFVIAIVVAIGNVWISYRSLSRLSENELASGQTTITSTLASLFSLGLLALLYYLFRCELSARQDVQVTLQGRENHLQTMLDAEPECVKVVAADGTLLEINPAGVAMIEAANAEAVIGQSVYPLVAPEYRATFQKMHERLPGQQSDLRVRDHYRSGKAPLDRNSRCSLKK